MDKGQKQTLDVSCPDRVPPVYEGRKKVPQTCCTIRRDQKQHSGSTFYLQESNVIQDPLGYVHVWGAVWMTSFLVMVNVYGGASTETYYSCPAGPSQCSLP